MKRLLITRALPKSVLDEATAAFDVQVWPHDRPIGEALEKHATGCDGLLVMANDRLDAGRLQTLARNVRAIATYSVGFDHIDLHAATALGLPIFNTPDVLSDAVAEIAMFLILAATRGTSVADTALRRGQWGPWSPRQFVGRQLGGRRLGIYGMGRIGRALVQRARGFGLEIHFHNRSAASDQFSSDLVYHDTLEGLMRVSEIFCVCAPSTAQTRGSVNTQRLALLPDGAIFVNIARGDLVDESALLDALESGRLDSAGIDVFKNEPNIDDRFIALPRATLLPHIGSASEEARAGMGLIAVQALDAWLKHGRRPVNCLNPQVLDSPVGFVGAP